MKHLIIFTLVLTSCVLITSCKEKEKTKSVQVQVEEQQTAISNPQPATWSFPFINEEIGNGTNKLPIAKYVRRIFQDSKGHLWFGTNSYGIVRYDGDTLIYFSKDDGLSGNQVTGVLEDKRGNIWISTDGGVSMYNGNTFTIFTEKDGLSSNSVWSIYEDSRGTIWAGTVKGLCKYNPEEGMRFRKFTLPKADVPNPRLRFSTKLVSSIMEDKNGNLWFGTDGVGIFRYDPSAQKDDMKAFTHITKKDGLCDNSIVSILEDSKGNIWLSSRFGGLSRYNPSTKAASSKRFTNYTVENGDIGNNEVWTMYEDNADNIWFSAEGYGVYRITDNQISNYGKDEGFPMGAVQSILEDKDGVMWIGGGNGLYSYNGHRFIEITRDYFRKGC